MKLLDQVFKVCSPPEWAEHLPVEMPSYWSDATADITSADIEFINWNSGFLMLAKYASEDEEEPFVMYRQSAVPTSVRLTFRENAPYTIKKIYGPEFNDRTMKHSCGCCITLFYTEDK